MSDYLSPPVFIFVGLTHILTNLPDMERLTATRLYSAVTESIAGKTTLVTIDWIQLWREFADTVAAIGSDKNHVTSFIRDLYRLCAEFRHLILLAIERGDMPCASLIEKALVTLESEIELINLGLRYPHIDRQAKRIESTLYIAEGFSQTDLVEIIKGMHAVRFSKRKDGASATLADLKLVLGAAFNVDFPRLDQNIHYTINRSKGPAQFLTRLVDVLEELSRK